MSFEELLEGIQRLACSQGFYGRLLEQIHYLPEDELEDLKEDWNGRFKTMLDFVLYIES